MSFELSSMMLFLSFAHDLLSSAWDAAVEEAASDHNQECDEQQSECDQMPNSNRQSIRHLSFKPPVHVPHGADAGESSSCLCSVIAPDNLTANVRLSVRLPASQDCTIRSLAFERKTSRYEREEEEEKEKN
jgi:hypothetical protein